MPVLCKTTLLKSFKHSSCLLVSRGDQEHQEYFVDESLVPVGAQHLQGNWEVTVTFSPAEKSDKKKHKTRICFFQPSMHNFYTACDKYVGPSARKKISTVSTVSKVTCHDCLSWLEKNSNG